MSAVEVEELIEIPGFRRELRIVGPNEAPIAYASGLDVFSRRAQRQMAKAKRQRRLVLAGVVLSLTLLAMPGHAFGGTTGAGLSTDIATSAELASGTLYIVQPGDSVASIAEAMNPVDPSLARQALVKVLRSSVVVPGEHILIP
jgi:hypothetical protein